MNIINLFSGETCLAATAVAAIFFALGAATTCIVCKLSCRKPCGSRKAAAKPREKTQAEDPKFRKRHPAPADGSIEIYVGNLSYDLTEDQLRKEFEAYGKVNSARIITNRYNGKSKGFGFVHMPNEAEVNKAIVALGEKEILGRKMKCNVAKNTEQTQI